MTQRQILDSDAVRNKIIVDVPTNAEHTLRTHYDVQLFGYHKWRARFINVHHNCICDFTLNQDIVWEAIIEKELETHTLRFDMMNNIFVKKIKFEKLTPELLQDIVDKNFNFFVKLKEKYDEMKILKELNAL